MKGPARRLSLLLLMSGLILLTSIGTIWILYRVRFETKRGHLVELARGASRLVTLAERNERGAGEETGGKEALDRILRVFDAVVHDRMLGETGEFELGLLDGGRVLLLLSRTSDLEEQPHAVSLAEPYGEPIRRAAQGLTGTMTGLDYRGVPVLAAYRPSTHPNLGIVAKIELAELRRPYVRAGGVVATVALFVIAGGLFVFFRVSEPLIRSVEESEQRYRTLFENAAEPVVLIDPATGRIDELNEPACRHLGYTRDEGPPPTLADIEVPGEGGGAARAARATGHVMTVVETRHRTKGGKLRDVRVSASAVSVGGKESLLEIWSDITEQKRAEAEIRRARDEMEQQVIVRTAELAQTNARLKAEVVEREQAEETMRELSRELLELQDREWQRIARELHDEFAQSLVAAQIGAQRLCEAVPQEREDLRRAAQQVTSSLASAIAITRTMLESLHPSVLDTLGLVPAIEALATDFQLRTGIPCELGLDGGPIDLSPEAQLALYRIVQEALNNVARHSGADRVTLSARRETGCLRLTVRDNGKGIGPDRLHAPGSHGLSGMRERAALCGGQLTITGSPSGGTEVRLEIST